MAAELLPMEIQLLIVEAACQSQHPTLRLVCKAWKSAIFRLLKRHYVEPFVPDQEWLAEHPHRVGHSPLEPPEAPFLIHRFFTEFTGYCRGMVQWDVHPYNEDFSVWFHIDHPGLDYPPKPDASRFPEKFEAHKRIVRDTERFKEYTNEPLIIPRTDEAYSKPVLDEITITFQRNSQSTVTHTLKQPCEPINTPSLVSVKWFMGEYMTSMQNRGWSLPKPGEKTGRFPMRHRVVRRGTVGIVERDEGAEEFSTHIFLECPSVWAGEKSVAEDESRNITGSH